MKSKKILLAVDTTPENPWNRDRLPAVKKALSEYDNRIIDIFEFYSREEAHEFHRMSHEDFLNNYNVRECNKKFYNKVVDYDPDIFVMGTIDNYSRFLLPETVIRLRRRGITVAGIFGDDEMYFNKHKIYAPLFNLVVAYVKKYVDLYGSFSNTRSFYMPNSCYFQEKDFDKLQSKEEYDVVLLGAPFSIRPELVKNLVLNDVKVGIFGSKEWEKYSLLKDSYQGFVPSDKFDQVIRKGKIVLAPLESQRGEDLHMNTKIWEAARNGRMCITTRYKPLTDDYGFKEGEEIVFYDSPEDLTEKVKFFLRSEEKREEIARKLFTATKDNFEYETMYKNLFKKICDLHDTNPNSYIRVDEEYKDVKNHLVTIVDKKKSGFKKQDGFSYVEYEDRADLQSIVDRINTPFVIFRINDVLYSSYINEILNFFPSEFSGAARFVEESSNYIKTIIGITNISHIIWEKDELKKYLDKKLVRVRIVDNLTEMNAPLSRSLNNRVENDVLPRVLFIGKAKDFTTRLKRKIKKVIRV